MAKLVRGIGWTLIVAGAIVLLYVVYLLWFTGFEAERNQRALADEWQRTVIDRVEPEDDRDVTVTPAPSQTADMGEAVAAIWFERNGEPIVAEEPLYVVAGVSLDMLTLGPGHYPQSAPPGGDGNFAIAGHRTTYGAPFWSVNELTEGDTIHIQDREGDEWVYAYREQRVVVPTDVWVVEEDPLGWDVPMITLTTCHPRGSARERLIVWGELVGEPRPVASTEATPVVDTVIDAPSSGANPDRDESATVAEPAA